MSIKALDSKLMTVTVNLSGETSGSVGGGEPGQQWMETPGAEDEAGGRRGVQKLTDRVMSLFLEARTPSY